jgi:hypothetical protein
MNNELKILILAFLILPVIFNAGHLDSAIAKSKDSKARNDFIKKAGRAVEGKWSKIEISNMSLFGSNSTITFYNKTKTVIIPPTPTPEPTPTPTPTGNTTTVCTVGDLSGSTVPNKMKGCDVKIGIGDLGYSKDLSYFKGLNFDKCVIGNHDAKEDGDSDPIVKEALAYCGDHWTLAIGNGTLLIGMNTNGDIPSQITAINQALQIASGIKTVVLISHKPCYTSPNSHHPVESNIKTLCESLVNSIPQGLKVYYVAAHNHQMASTVDGLKFVSGAGGRSHYACSTDNIWNFCDDKNYGYLEMKIDNNNGNIGTKFVK